MKHLRVLNVVFLILLLSFSDLSQERYKTEATADDLLIKFIEYFDKRDSQKAIGCLQKAVELDPTKYVYIEIMGHVVDGRFNEALKLLGERKDKSPAEKELKGFFFAWYKKQKSMSS